MVVIEQNKSGFERPGDVEFEDFSQGINRASSDSSLGTPKGPMDLLGKNRNKNFWLFSKRSKVGTLHTGSTVRHSPADRLTDMKLRRWAVGDFRFLSQQSDPGDPLYREHS